MKHIGLVLVLAGAAVVSFGGSRVRGWAALAGAALLLVGVIIMLLAHRKPQELNK